MLELLEKHSDVHRLPKHLIGTWLERENSEGRSGMTLDELLKKALIRRPQLRCSKALHGRFESRPLAAHVDHAVP